MSKQREKFISKLDKKRKIYLLNAIKNIIENNGDKEDIKSIKLSDNLYRCRIGNIRILFNVSGKNIIILKIGSIYK